MGEVAVKDGVIYPINKEDFFDIGKLSVKTLSQSVTLSINKNLHDYSNTWVNQRWKAFGPKAMVALAFWFGSLFSEQINAVHKNYPFLKIVGEANSGKTMLIEFLWKLFGRDDYEGFDPSKSSLKGGERNFAQVLYRTVNVRATKKVTQSRSIGTNLKSLSTDAASGREA